MSGLKEFAMSRRCAVTGKTILVGHNVSHANNKTKRRFMPNLQVISLTSESLGRRVRLKLSTSGLRTIETSGGLDAWLTAQAPSTLAPELRRLRSQVTKAQERKAAA
jgi:large subunit ribosomal protein L28